MLKYGLSWNDAQYDAARIEQVLLKYGGKIEGRGEGLLYHFKEYWKHLWPDDVQNEWTDLIMKEILENQFTAVIGPGSSWKTSTTARLVLMDWSLFPDCTYVIVSSTTRDDLQARIFGEMAKLWGNAKELYDWFPGNLVDHKGAITHEQVKDDLVRDMRNAIIGVPCMGAQGKFVGVGRYSGRKNRRVWSVSDECFPAGTLVDTPFGSRPIEMLRPGDLVLNCMGVDSVEAVRCSQAYSLLELTFSDGIQIACTPNHPFLTSQGWLSACDLKRGQYMVSVYESMHLLRETNSEQKFLQRELYRQIRDFNARRSSEVLLRRAQRENLCFQEAMAQNLSEAFPVCYSQNAQFDSGSRSRTATQICGDNSENGMASSCSSRQWHRADSDRGNSFETIPRFDQRTSRENGETENEGPSNILQSGRGFPRLQTGSGMRWSESFQPKEPKTRSEERPRLEKIRVVGGSLFQQGHTDGYRNRRGGTPVFNLQVARHHSYSVSGLTVKNCQFMHRSLLDAQENLISNGPNLVPGVHPVTYQIESERGKPLHGYKAVFIGNPNPTRPENPLHTVAEPEGGWPSVANDGKTKCWNARQVPGSVVRCRVVNLDGRDSPNNAFPYDHPRWPNLISAQRLDKYAKDSEGYWSQGVGFVMLGLAGSKVITKELCDQFLAFDSIVWRGEQPNVKVAALDAAYGGVGGDRCVLMWGEFGPSAVDDVVRLKVNDTWVVPVKILQHRTPEDQIAKFCREQLEGVGVLPENLFFDGRGAIGMSFSRIWSTMVNTIEFGGRPSDRPIGTGNEAMIEDEYGQRRPKLAWEFYSKFVTELWWSSRLAIESGQIRGLTDEIVYDGQPREWYKVAGDKIEIESKRDMKKRTGMSPDLYDAFVVLLEGARRKGFKIRTLGDDPKLSIEKKYGWLLQMEEERNEIRNSLSLQNV